MKETQTKKPSAATMTAISNIKSELARRDQGQIDLANYLGENKMWMSRRMSGAVPFTIDEIERIAAAFEKPVAEMFAEAAPVKRLTVARPSDYKSPVPAKTRPTNRRDRSTGPSNRVR